MTHLSIKVLLITLGLFWVSFTIQNDFLSEQKRYERVRTAIKEKQSFLDKKLKSAQLSSENIHLIFIAYKDDGLLEVYAKSKQAATYQKLLSYPICARSGQLGPKQKQGDGQVPEGFYHIDRFNPVSNFYLSLGLNYPNLADKKRNTRAPLGGDIFIHGACVTIGCLPMTDDKIKEIYLLAVHAKNNGQSKIPVYVFPFNMTDEQMDKYKTKYSANKELISFWNNLKIGHDQFIKSPKELNFKVKENGEYSF